MRDTSNPIGTKKIEALFASNFNFFEDRKTFAITESKSRFSINKISKLTKYILKKVYNFLPNFLKDLFYCVSVLHKAPATKFFANTKYDEMRTNLDIRVSSWALKSSPKTIADDVKKAFDIGYYISEIANISDLESLVDEVIEYSAPSHAGARPYFKDGKNSKINDSFSAYYNFSHEANSKITEFLRHNLDKDFNYYLSAIAGYNCEFQDIEYSLGVVHGENSNSEMHQDTYGAIAKGFIYLQDIDTSNSPFQYLEQSYLDAKFRSQQTNDAVKNNDTENSGSTRIRGEVFEEAISRFKLKSFEGPKGLFVLANTAGYHRKGPHGSSKPRITINFEIKRKGVISKALINSFK